MERELTVKVNYVLGNQSAFIDAATAAETVKNKVASATTQQMTMIDKIRSAIGAGPAGILSQGAGVLSSAGGGIMGLLRGGGVLAGLGIGAAVHTGGMLTNDLLNMTAGGGGGMRGYGFSGMLDSIVGTLTGRGYREHVQDLKLSEGSHFAGLVGQRLGLEREQRSVYHEARYRPVTEVDPYIRMERERKLLESRRTDLMADKASIHTNYKRDRAKMEQDRILAMKSGGPVDQFNVAKLDREYQMAREVQDRSIAQVTEQIAGHSAGVFQSRKQEIASGKMAFGGMNMFDRRFAVIAAEKLKNGQRLSPEERGILSSFPMYHKAIRDHDMREADQGGFGELAELTPDEAYGPAAKRARQKGTRIEDELDAAADFEFTQAQRQIMGKKVGEALANAIDWNAVSEAIRQYQNPGNFLGDRK